MLNLSILLEDSARHHPDKIAYIFGDATYTFSQINAMANKVANGLKKLGLKRSDKVALSCINSPSFPIIYNGILKAGCTVVPLSVLLKKDEIAYHLSNSDAKAYFCFIGTADLPMLREGQSAFNEVPTCEHLIVITEILTSEAPIDEMKTFGTFIKDEAVTFANIQTKPGETAVIIYTSGTTGRPKGAELSHANLLMNAISCVNLFKIVHEDIFITVLPMFHIFAMTVKMNAALYLGITNVLIPRFDVLTVIRAIEKNKVTVFVGVPTMYWGLLNAKSGNINIESAMKSLRIGVSGGASLPVQVLHDFEKRFDIPIYEGYGMSEGSPVVTFNHFGKTRKPGSVGTVIWGLEVKIVDEKGKELPAGEKGELLYRGHNVMKGYYKNAKATRDTIKNGWLHSGDIAVMDEDGYFFIVDRTKDLIIRGGFNVYPREVEEVIMQHPDVSLVAVIGLPDAQYGEEIKACVVLKAGSTVSEQALIEFTKQHIASYKYPRHIQFMSSLPLNASGKILKTALRKPDN